MDEFRRRAKKTGSKYQTLINEALKEAVTPIHEEKLENIISRIDFAARDLRTYRKKIKIA